MRGVTNSEENRKKCICPSCPSYPENCRGELLYCGKGKSKCEIPVSTCVCPGCPVYKENQLSGLFFCDKEDSLLPVSLRKIRPAETDSAYEAIAQIKKIAASGESQVGAMGSLKQMPFSFKDIHFIPAQVFKIPVNAEQPVNTEVIIGPSAKKPIKISVPIMITGMSFGALSRNTKIAIALAVKEIKTAYSSGEGGILPEDLEIAREFLIGQYATGRFGFDEKVFSNLAGIEIKFGQGAYPGKGSFLPAEKITPEVAKVRGLKPGEPSYSPARHPDMRNPEEIKAKVDWLRKIGGGVPVGAKIGCGNVEGDIEVLVNAGVDYISMDGFGGGTGATNFYARENVGIPIVAALPRAVKKMKEMGVKKKISLIVAGGLRTSADFTKCLALGANAVYIGTAALIAVNCEQYRMCHTDLCPTGVTTQLPSLTAQLDPEKGKQRLVNFIKVSTEEISNIVRIVGKNDVKDLNPDDLVSLDKDLSELVKIKWLSGKAD